MGRLKAKGVEIEQSPISMKGVAASADLVESGTISGKMLKDLYDLCFERNQDFPEVYEARRPPAAIHRHFRAGKDHRRNPRRQSQATGTIPRRKKTMIGFFVGQVMKASKGQANPQLVNELLSKKLG